MTRIALVLAAGLIASPAVAGTYSAKLSTPAAGKIIARDIAWACGPAACSGRTDESRPLVICQGLAKRAGRLETFAVDGRAFAADELARCNSAAKGGTVAVANANN